MRSAVVRRLRLRVEDVHPDHVVLAQPGVEVPRAGDDPHEYDHSEHGHDPMMGMLTDRQMRQLEHARGAEFDRLFLRGMIQHHEGAIDMASTVARKGTDLLVGELAADVTATQAAEISRMQQLLES